MDIKKLLLILIALILAYFLIDWSNSRSDQSFDPLVVALDTAAVNKIELNIKDQPVNLTIEKKPEGWFINEGTMEAPADPMRIKNLLSQISDIQALRFAAKSKEKWNDFEIGDDATRVIAYQDDQKLADFYVGRFAFNQQTRSGTSYVRLAGEEAVYAVEGFLSISFSPGIDAYRNKSLWKTEVDNISLVNFPTKEIELHKSESGMWDLENLKLDSTAWNNYLTRIATAQAQNFEYEISNWAGQPFWSMKAADLQIDVQADTNSQGQLILQVQEGADPVIVNDKDSVIYNKLMKPFIDEQ